MRAIRQTTLLRAVSISGVGLHTGAEARATLRPAGADSGIVFRRNGAAIPACVAAISDTRLGTTLADAGGACVRTVEHLMAAVAIASIDNLVVDVAGDEMPILDGSAAPWLDAIEGAGLDRLDAPRMFIKVLSPVEESNGVRSIRAIPHDGRRLEIAIDFGAGAIGAQSLTIDLDDAASLRRLARARTFCHLADIEAMRGAGLGNGGSLDNAIVVDGDRILNPAGLRDPDEFVLHKALDLVGDLALAGAPILGAIVARQPGHGLNACFLRKLLGDGSASERVGAFPPVARAIA